MITDEQIARLQAAAEATDAELKRIRKHRAAIDAKHERAIEADNQARLALGFAEAERQLQARQA